MSVIATAVGTALAKEAITKAVGKGMTGAQSLGPVLATQAITRMTPSGQASAKLDKEARIRANIKGPSAGDAAFRQALMQAAAQGQGSVEDRKTDVMKRLAAGGGLFTSGRAMQEAMAGGGLPAGTLGEIANAESARRALEIKNAKNRIDAKTAETKAMLYDSLTKQKPEDKQAATAANMQQVMGLASKLGG